MGLNIRTIAKYIKGYETEKTRLTGSKGDSNQEGLIADIVEDLKHDASNRKKVKLTEEIMDRIKFCSRGERQKNKRKRLIFMRP